MRTYRILVLHPKGFSRDTFFPDIIKKQMDEIGEVHWNPEDRAYHEDELIQALQDIDICLGGWNAPLFTDRVLSSATKLKFIGHTGGSIRHYLPPEIFNRNITVTNAPEAMAKYVAEGAMCLFLASLKDIIGLNHQLKTEMVLDNLVLFLKGKLPKNIVSREEYAIMT